MRLGSAASLSVVACAVVCCTRSGDRGNRATLTTRDASALVETPPVDGSGALSGQDDVPTGNALGDITSLQKDPSVFDRTLSEAEVLEALSQTEQGNESERLNEWIAVIYARRGREFGVGKWALLAESLSWYRRDPSYTDARLTPTDRANLELLERLRRRYPPLNAVAPPDPNSEVDKDLFPGCPPGARAEAWPSEQVVVTLKCVEPIGKSTRPHGPAWTWYPNGRLASTEHYVHGELDGRRLTWYSHGARRDEQHYDRGKADGLWRRFHANGRTAMTANYRSGQPHGSWTAYYPGGSRAIVTQYDAGQITGPFEAFLPPAATEPNPAPVTPGADRESKPIPDGPKWPENKTLDRCKTPEDCRPLLGGLDPDSLPPIVPSLCGLGATTELRPVAPNKLQDALLALEQQPYGGFVKGPVARRLKARCAPDVDGDGHPELFTEITWCAGEPAVVGDSPGYTPCTARSNLDDPNTFYIRTWAIVSPSRGATTPSKVLNVITGACNLPGMQCITDERWLVDRFVRLPDGSLGYHLRTTHPSEGPCNYRTETDTVVVPAQPQWHAVISNTKGCEQPALDAGLGGVW